MTTTVQPGTIGLTQINGEVGRIIRFGQFLNGAAKPHYNALANYEHAFLAIADDGAILEAEPGGARVGNVSEYSHIYWCENIAAKYSKGLNDVVAAAHKYVGVPYSFLDYGALAARRLHLPVPGLRKYIASTGHMICSQLCARAYLDAGCALYTEWTGYVDPLDLYNLDRSLV